MRTMQFDFPLGAPYQPPALYLLVLLTLCFDIKQAMQM